VRHRSPSRVFSSIAQLLPILVGRSAPGQSSAQARGADAIGRLYHRGDPMEKALRRGRRPAHAHACAGPTTDGLAPTHRSTTAHEPAGIAREDRAQGPSDAGPDDARWSKGRSVHRTGDVLAARTMLWQCRSVRPQAGNVHVRCDAYLPARRLGHGISSPSGRAC